MGFVLPGHKFVRYGDKLLSGQSVNEIMKVPTTKVGKLNSLTRTSDSIARVKTAAANISRTAPTFNDPRYTFTTLSIPTDQRTLNGLYRFFDDTDPVVGNAVRLHCLPAGEQVLTQNGLKNIENITIEDQTIGYNGKYQKVLDTFSSQYDGKLYTIKAMGTLPLTCTDEHRILVCGQKIVKVRSDSSRKEPTKQLTWKPAKDVNVGDYVVFPKYVGNSTERTLIDLSVHVPKVSKRNQQVCKVTSSSIQMCMGQQKEYPRYIEVNELFAELAGWYVAEGSIAKDPQSGKPSRVQFALGEHEPENIKRVAFLLKTIFGINAPIVPNKYTKGVEIFGLSALAARVFSSMFGMGAHNKKIAPQIMNGSPEVVKAFIKAYIAGDGHKEKYEYSVVTVSKTLAYQLKLLGTKIGLFFGLREMPDQYITPEYFLRVTKRAAAKILYNEEGPKKSHPHYYYEDDQFFYVPIRKITTKEFKGTVYDITTKDHTFLQNFLIHNSEFPLSRLSLKDCGDPVIQRHYEDMWNRLNVQKLLFDIAIEYWRLGNCLTPETEILTSDGYKQICDVSVGDKVLTSSGKFHGVLDILVRQTSEPTYQIIPWKMNLFGKCTGDHPILTNNGWVLAKDLKIGDYVRLSLPERNVKDIDTLYLESSRTIIRPRDHSHENLDKKEKFIDWLLSLKTPQIASYSEVEKKFRFTSGQLLNYITTIQKTGVKVLRRRIHSPKETTQWEGLDLNGLTKEECLKGIRKRTFESSIEKINISNEFLYILGYWLGDGCLFRNSEKEEKYNLKWNDWQICFSEKYKYIAEHIVNVFKNVFGRTIKIDGGVFNSSTDGGTPHNIRIRDPLFCEWWGNEFGGKCKEKRIPQWVYNLPNEKLKHLLAGLIDSDGSITHNGFEISGTNKNLISAIHQIGLALGYEFGVRKQTGGKEVAFPQGNKCVSTDTYTVYFSDRELAPQILKHSLKDKFIFNSTESKERRKSKMSFIDGKWYAQIRKIVVEEFEGSVYDLHVDSVHDFDASGIIVHNCFPFLAWNVDDYMWDQAVILNPDYITVESTYLNKKPSIKLQPDEHLKRIVSSGQPRELYEQLPPQLIKYIRLGQEIPLSTNNVFHLAHNKAPYETLGRSIIKRILKTLIYEDRMSQANFAIATRQVIPITVVKLGDPQSVEEDHLINYLEGDQLKVCTFKDFWEKYDGPIVVNDGFKEVKNVVSHGLKTLSQNVDGTQSWNFIENILRHPTPKEVVEVTTPHGQLRMTEGHGLMWINPNTTEYEHVTPTELRAQNNSTIVTMDRFDYSIKAQTLFGLPLTTDLAYFVGLWTADGSFTGNRNSVGDRKISTHKLQISNKDAGIENYLNDRFGNSLRKYSYVTDTTFSITYPELVNKLVSYYDVPDKNGSCAKSGKERVPQELLFNGDDDIVGAFFAGVIDGDGWLTETGFYGLGVSCGKSREYHHWLSLGLLAKGIMSKVRFRANAWELTVSGKRDVLKLLDLVEPFITHSKKKRLCEKHRSHFENVQEHQDKVYVYDLSLDTRQELFNNSPWRGSDGRLPTTIVQNRPRVNRFIVQAAGNECNTKEVCSNLCGVRVSKIVNKPKSSEYVYDLMLKDAPHCYLTAGSGWVESSNSGWVPEPDEIDDVKEMLACHDDQTEILTEDGFKLFKNLNGTERVGCFNSETNELEYHLPEKYHEYDYDGKLVHFCSSRVDTMITPNHRMWVQQLDVKDESWKFKRADELKVNRYRFRSVVDWQGITPPETLQICGKEVNTKDYLKFLGWFISEGSCGNWITHTVRGKEYRQVNARVNQLVGSGADEIQTVLDDLGFKYNVGHGQGKNHPYLMFNIKEEFAQYLYEKFAGGCQNKYIPREILSYDKEHLQVLLDSLLAGDGHITSHQDGRHFDYTTTSCQLADDVCELALKLGYSPKIVRKIPKDPKHSVWYAVYFSDSSLGYYPTVRKMSEKQYTGKVYCVTVPTGIIITKRNGKIQLAGNSREVDPNFSIVYHWGINIEFYGASGRIWNLANEFARTMKWKLMGLGISEAILSGGTNYASAYAQLEVLRQRYLHFQMMLERFIHQGLFEPVAKICGFYKTDKLVSGASYIGKSYGEPNEELGKITKQSIVSDNPAYRQYVKAFDSPSGSPPVQYIYPKIDWDLMSLNNDVQYKNFLMNFDKMFPGERKVSDETFYNVALLDKEAEQKKLLKEYKERLDKSLEKAKVNKIYLEKFTKAGLTPPAELIQGVPGPEGPGEGAPMGMGGVGAPSIPGMPSPEGGGVGAGGQVETPAAPVGQPSFQGAKTPGGPTVPGGPAQARQESLQIQRQMTSSTLDEQLKKEGTRITSENQAEAAQLKKTNEKWLKQRAQERGDPGEA